jgi:hypothetical protein
LFEQKDLLLDEIGMYELEQLEHHAKDLQQGFSATANLYEEMVQLCENEIIDSSIKQMYDDLCNDIEATRQIVTERMQFLKFGRTEEGRTSLRDAEIQQQVDEQRRICQERYQYSKTRPRSAKRNHILTTHSSESSEPTLSYLTRLNLRATPPHVAVNLGLDDSAGRRHERESTNQYSCPQTTTSSKAQAADSTCEMFKQMANCFANAISSSRLPAAEPAIFRGEALEYLDWEMSFSQLIESKGLSEVEKLHYLRKYVDGEARECVNGYFLCNSSDAFSEAKAQLKRRYGNPFDTARAFRDKLASWPKVSGKDPYALRKYADFLTQCLSAIESIPALNVLNDSRENERMAEKLPDWLTRRWCRIVAETKRSKLRYPEFAEFVRFIREESEIMTEPIMIQALQRDCHTTNQPKENSLRRSEERRVGKECRSRWSPYH